MESSPPYTRRCEELLATLCCFSGKKRCQRVSRIYKEAKKKKKKRSSHQVITAVVSCVRCLLASTDVCLLLPLLRLSVSCCCCCCCCVSEAPANPGRSRARVKHSKTIDGARREQRERGSAVRSRAGPKNKIMTKAQRAKDETKHQQENRRAISLLGA